MDYATTGKLGKEGFLHSSRRIVVVGNVGIIVMHCGDGEAGLRSYETALTGRSGERWWCL